MPDVCKMPAVRNNPDAWAIIGQNDKAEVHETMSFGSNPELHEINMNGVLLVPARANIILDTYLVPSSGVAMFIDRIVRFLMPRQGIFFTMLEEIAEKIKAAAAVFGELTTVSTHDQLESVAARLKPIETEADKVCNQLYMALDRTFVTPFDREDLAALTKTLDDVIDAMEHTAAFASLYHFDVLPEPMCQLVRITIEASQEVAGGVYKLRRFVNPESIRSSTVTVHTLENEADLIYRGAVAALFQGTPSAMELTRQKDMLYSLEDGIDRCERAMDVIRSVVVKNG